MKISKKTFIELLLLLLLGLTPLLWFHGNELILGHDAGLPLSPVMHFLDRLHVWTDRYGFGYDQSLFLPGFFIHGIEAFAFSIVHSLQLEQKITFVFWFVLPGITMYYFAYKIAKKYNLLFFALPSAIFYVFNHFLLQGWFIAERTKFSLYAALPLLLAFLFDWQENKRTTIRSAIFIAITFFFLNGEGSLPLFGGILLALATFVVFYFLPGFSLKKISRILALIGLTIIASVLLNVYWFLPYVQYVSHSFLQQLAEAGGLNGILGWLNYVSADSSLINLLRLQGIPEWYQNPLHPYANIFLGNPVLVAISYLIPVFAFLPLLIIKGKTRKYVIFFSFLAIFSIIFSAGSHPPFGTFYILLINFLPGFIAFRTPFYKFSPAVWFSYAILISFSINYFLERFRIRKGYKYLLLGVVCIGIILYSYPFLTGSFFNYVVGQRSNRISVPSYVFDFAKWSDSPARANIRTLALPRPNVGNNIEAYTWGYWSPAPLTSLLTNASVVNPTGLLPGQEYTLVENVYDMMIHNTPGWENYAKSLGIQSFLLRKDFAWNLKESPTDSPQDYSNALKSNDLIKVKTFGQWDIYDFKDQDNASRIQTSSSLSYISGTPADMSLIEQVPDFNGQEPYYIAGDIKKKNLDILQFADSIYIKPFCIQCNLQNPIIDLGAYVPLLTHSSRIYKVMNALKKPSLDVSITDVAYSSLRNLLEFQKELDKNDTNTNLTVALQAYINTLDRLNNLVSINTAEINPTNNAQFIEIANILRNEKILIVQRIESIKSPEQSALYDILTKNPDILSLYKQSLSSLEDVQKSIEELTWVTQDETHKRYLLEVPKADSYTILYRSNDPLLQVQKVPFVIDNSQITVNPTIEKNNWLSLGQMSLSKGIHKFEIQQQTSNLFIGPQDFNLFSSTSGSCFFSDKIIGKKDQVVRVSFEHKQIAGTKEFSVFISKDTSQSDAIDVQGDALQASLQPENYTLDYSFQNEEPVFLAICNIPESNSTSVSSAIDIQNLNIRNLYSPDVLLYAQNNQSSQSTIPYKKISPLNYEIKKNNISNTQKLLVFKETYGESWNIGNNSNRFMVNGFANAWIIDNLENKSILYSGQNLVTVGFIISSLSFIIAVIMVIMRKKK